MPGADLIPLLLGALLTIAGGWATSAIADRREQRRKIADERRACYEDILEWAARVHDIYVTLGGPPPHVMASGEVRFPKEELDRLTVEWHEAEDYLVSGQAYAEMKEIVNTGRFYLVASPKVGGICSGDGLRGPSWVLDRGVTLV